MDPRVWWRLPLLGKIATLIAGVFFGQRFDYIGHNRVVPGQVCGPAMGPYVLHGGPACKCHMDA